MVKTLSSKIHIDTMSVEVIDRDDVKRFIKDLKDETKKGIGFCGDSLYFIEIIHKLAGGELV